MQTKWNKFESKTEQIKMVADEYKTKDTRMEHNVNLLCKYACKTFFYFYLQNFGFCDKKPIVLLLTDFSIWHVQRRALVKRFLIFFLISDD